MGNFAHYWCTRELRIGVLAMSASIIAAAVCSPARAQIEPVSPPICSLQIARSDDPVPNALVAKCGGQFFVLGLADKYSTVSNPGLRAMLVDVQRGPERRIWSLTQEGQGQFALEDITTSIALSAGRGPLSGLRGLQIDLTRFASDGIVAVKPDGPAIAGVTGEVRMGDRLAITRARANASRTQN